MQGRVTKLLVQTAGHGAAPSVSSMKLLPRRTPVLLWRTATSLAPIRLREDQWEVVSAGVGSIEAGEGSFYRFIERPRGAGEVVFDKGSTGGSMALVRPWVDAEHSCDRS